MMIFFVVQFDETSFFPNLTRPDAELSESDSNRSFFGSGRSVSILVVN